MGGIPPIADPSGVSTSQSSVVSRAFFGVTHGVDHLITFAQEVIFNLRYGQTKLASSYLQEMLTSDCPDYQLNKDGISATFAQDSSERRKYRIVDKKRDGQDSFQTFDEVNSFHLNLKELCGTQATTAIEKTLHQGVFRDVVPGVFSPRQGFNSLSRDNKCQTEITVIKEDSRITYSWIGEMAFTDMDKQDVEPTRYLVKFIVQAPLEELNNNQLKKATYQFQFKKVLMPSDLSEGPITRMFRWLFSWALDPVAKKLIKYGIPFSGINPLVKT